MNYTIILRPLIGAGIGYITNYIAVKMMFRPLKPIKIGKFTLPFTPGIIPKNKKRIAHSIGITISENLITKEDLNKTLLSADIEKFIRDNLKTYLDSNANITIKEKLIDNLSTEKYEDYKSKLTSFLSTNIINSLKESDIGKILSEQIVIAIDEKISNSLIRAFINNAMISSLVSNIENKINLYIDENGETLVSDMINKELDKYSKEPISSIQEKLINKDIDVTEILVNLYRNFISNKLSSILKLINISQIVEDKINSMDMLELEKLILQVMKKELNALVNLGAIIGFVLGLLNLLF